MNELSATWGRPRPTAGEDGDCTLFQAPWWLEVVAAGAWHAISVRDDLGGSVWLPFVCEWRLGFTRIAMPPHTPTLGPVTRSARVGPEADAARRALLASALARLPPHAGFHQVLEPGAVEAADFAACGFTVGEREGLRFAAEAGLGAVWDGFGAAAQAKVLAADRSLQAGPPPDRETFHALCARHGRQRRGEREFHRRLDAALAPRPRHRIVAVHHRLRRVVAAAALLAWDGRAVRCLRAFADPAYEADEAPSLLLWEALRHAASLGLPLDPMESLGEPAFLRACGAAPVVAPVVSASSRLLRTADWLRGRRPPPQAREHRA